MKLIGLFGFLTLFALNFENVSAWDQEELEIFDLVEEINQNFYTILKIDQQASPAEIRKAFRSLSVVLHPDKNDAEDANVQFRNLVSVYEVLKDSTKREKYNKVLKDGLPDWRSALYYYRRYRKMGLAEMIGLVFVIFTTGQYIVAWAVYAEKKYTAESLFGSKIRKLQRKNKSAVNIDELLNQIPTPSIKNTLPFQIVRGVWNTPGAIRDFFSDMNEYKQQIIEEKRREAEEAEQQRQLEEEIARAKEAKKEGMRKRKPVFTAREKTDEELKGYAQLNLDLMKGTGVKAVKTKTPVLSGGFWTDDDLNELTRLTKKYPNGTLSRWEVIAEHMNRSVQEVTFMAAKMKEPSYRQTDSVAESIVQEATKKVKKIVGDVKTPPVETVWTQEQQKLLETAIVKYPKTIVGDRWQKIANTVPNKTKEECLARYKYLVQKLKEQKQKEAENEEKVQNTEDIEIDRVESVENPENESKPEPVPELVEEEKSFVAKKTSGKPRNKRKERKKCMNFSSDEEDNLDYE